MSSAQPPAAYAARRLAVHSLVEFAFSVPDLAEARHFYASFGLDVRGDAAEVSLYAHGHAHRWARVLPGPSKRLLWVSFGIHRGDLPAFEHHLAARGVAAIPAPAGAGNDGLWIAGPDGVPLQLRVADKPSLATPTRAVPAIDQRDVGRCPGRDRLPPTHPSHLSHILLFSSNVSDAVRFYGEVLGLRLSDRAGTAIAFMHTPHGGDHHLIAFARSDGPGLHHSSWCVQSIDELGAGAQQMRRAGYVEGWGIGRHVLGSNYFQYVRDPWGSYAEYSYDIDYIREGSSWTEKDHAAHDAIFAWGPEMPEDFIANKETVKSASSVA